MINARSHSDLRGFGGGEAPSRAPGGEARGVAAWAEAGAARTSVWEEVANILVDVADFPGPEAQKRAALARADALADPATRDAARAEIAR